MTWTSASSFLDQNAQERELAVERQRQARLAAIRKGSAPQLEETVWTRERIGRHLLGLYVAEAVKRHDRDLWHAICRCGWESRQGYPRRTQAVAHWRDHGHRAFAEENVSTPEHQPRFAVRRISRTSYLSRWGWTCSCGASTRRGFQYREDAECDHEMHAERADEEQAG